MNVTAAALLLTTFLMTWQRSTIFWTGWLARWCQQSTYTSAPGYSWLTPTA